LGLPAAENPISQLPKVTSGTIKINSQKISELSDNEVSRYRNEEIGFIFQEFHLEPMLTVMENVLLPTKFRQPNSQKSYKNSPEKLAEKLLTEVGLKDKLHQNIRTLSGGQSSV
jgi:ABC-type lipoprotein export system ATPase subunit